VGIWIHAPALQRDYEIDAAPPDDPIAAAVRLALDAFPHHALGAQVGPRATGWRITIHSSIPIASGLGSGAAVCTAVVRAIAAFLEASAPNERVAAIVFETEKLLHGTPSGIDNTVIAHGQPLFFIKGQPPEPFAVAHPFRLLIGDTGLASPTKAAVADVRTQWEKAPERFNALFAEIGGLVRQAREILQAATASETFAVLGRLLDRNHALLCELNVSCPELEALVEAARRAGARGAKLSGGGRGGNMIALVTDATEGAVQRALEQAGARRVIATTIGRTNAE
jgi:mevalonate kinase